MTMWLQSRILAIGAVILVMSMTVATAVIPARAATVTSASDTLSSNQVSAAANHTVLFTTSSAFSDGETLTLAFASGFTTSSITEDDVDVEDDGVDLTTASSCAGSEQASVAMASNTLTITICSGDGGTIAASSVIGIRIGTEATSSGTGSNRMTNPSSAGYYYLVIGGTFGDTGTLVLPIDTNTVTTVSAVVPSPPSGGPVPGPGPGPSDTIAPVLCCVTTSGLSETTITISWQSDEAATSFVDFGLTMSYELGSASVSGLSTSHSVGLAGLTPGATYHYRVRSADATGNSATLGDFVFTTPDATAPVISNVQVVDITSTSARVTWTTNESASSTVTYGTVAPLTATSSDAALVTSHSMLLTALAPATTYSYYATSVDASSNTASSATLSFATLVDSPPANVSGLTVTPGVTSLSFAWTNPTDLDFAGVLLKCSTTGYPTVTDSSPVVYNGPGTSATATGLTAGATYFCSAFAYDAAGLAASGAIVSSVPLAATIPPTVPTPTPTPTPTTPSPVAPGDGGPSGSPGGGPGGGAVCGNTVCESAESVFSCPADCPVLSEVTPSPTGSVCGNAACETGEDASSCSLDCSAPSEMTTVPASAMVPNSDAFVRAGNEQIVLPIRSGHVRLLTARPVTIGVASDHFVLPVSQVELNVGADRYVMAQRETSYAATIAIPSAIGFYPISIIIRYFDASQQVISFTGDVVLNGMVYEQGDRVQVPLADVRVTVLQDRAVWDASVYGQFNPVETEIGGAIAWYVPTGTWLVRAEKEGYDVAEQTVRVDDGLLRPSLRMVSSVVPTPVGERVSNAIGAIADAARGAADSIEETLDVIREVPGVSETAVIAQPVVATTAVATTVVLASSFNLLPLLQYLFTAPVLFFARRRRKSFGVVYHAVTKLPVDLATVRLVRASDGKVLKSRVTDRGGRYFFTAEPGQYTLVATKAGFGFPSSYVEGHEDAQYLDVYHGEPVEVTDEHAVIAANIPLDPTQSVQEQTPAHVRRLAFLRWLQKIVAISGVILALVALAIAPGTFAAGVVVLQVLVYLGVRRLAHAPKPKSWGIVYDAKTRKPLARTVVRVFEPKYQKLLESAITDSKGRYTFLLGPNEYFSTYQKEGYQSKELRPIDYKNKKEPTELSEDIGLEK